ncbi:MAG: YceI family protein [Candidatus Latescibacteria bacterium]|nr:YceI family protein [Candidatus Latescibacterota bacterium]
MTFRKTMTALLAASLLTAAAATAATYTIDATHSSVGFKVRHLMVSKVTGSFGEFSGTVDYVEGQPDQWAAAAAIKTASVNTNDAKRDDHLRNADFFDAEKHPEITFTSTGVSRKGDDWVLAGDLTMHGVTKPVELVVEFNGAITDPWGNDRIGFSATGVLDRRDFGITYNTVLDKGGVAVGNEVELMLEIEAIANK